MLKKTLYNKTMQSDNEMNDVQQVLWGWSDRVGWVIESVFLHLSDKGFSACLGN